MNALQDLQVVSLAYNRLGDRCAEFNAAVKIDLNLMGSIVVRVYSVGGRRGCSIVLATCTSLPQLKVK